MNQQTVLIAFLDKAWPPQHSFVNGMLTDVVAKAAGIKVRLCVSRSSQAGLNPRRYRGVACIPGLHPRRGSGRIKNLWVALRLIFGQACREKQRGNRVVLFVRNDPIYLLAASFMRSRVDLLVFQSSFPHEEYSGHPIKRRIARLLYRIAGRGVDVVTGVSPEGVIRTNKLFPKATAGPHIPLLVDAPSSVAATRKEIDPETGPTFVYIGTHAPDRELDVVLKGIVLAVKMGAKARFRFVGATPNDQARLSSVEGIEELLKCGIVKFDEPVSRPLVPKILVECHVGLSLIPPKEIYYESSPTKLPEYMGAGLAVLASKGIPMQERFVADSGGGLLVDWNERAIAEGIHRMADNYESIAQFRLLSKFYADERLVYSKYLDDFLLLCQA